MPLLSAGKIGPSFLFRTDNSSHSLSLGLLINWTLLRQIITPAALNIGSVVITDAFTTVELPSGKP